MEGEAPTDATSLGVVTAQRKGEENTCWRFWNFERLHGDASAGFLCSSLVLFRCDNFGWLCFFVSAVFFVPLDIFPK